MQSGLLTLLVFVPSVGAALAALVGKGRDRLCRWLALLTSLTVLGLAGAMFVQFDADAHGMQFVDRVSWVARVGIDYHLGVDGISMLLVSMTAVLMVLAVLASWRAIAERVRAYMVSLLLLETGMVGVFCAQDLFLFYVFWEAMLIPMYLLIGVWGGERRIYAAVKFVLYTLLGSLLMLVAIIVLYLLHGQATGDYSFDLQTLSRFSVPHGLQYWLFLAFFLSFAIKVPLFPFHTWLPDAHVEAPTAGSVILAGVLLKMGTYGLLRFCLPLFPAASLTLAPYIMILAIVGIIYGALVAMVQTDLKKLVAYSSVSHLGFVALGIFALNMQGMQGSVIQMVSHGLSTGGLFLVVGMIYERRHTRMIADFGGLARTVPVLSAFFLIITLSSIGLPGLNGFVGEFLILLGAFERATVFGVAAALGVVLAAVYMLWMYQRVVWGEVTHDENRGLGDLTGRELTILVPLVALMFWIGVFPSTFLSKSETSVRDLVSSVQIRRMEAAPRTYTMVRK